MKALTTPRTDKVVADDWSGGAAAVPYEFAQKLERENKLLKAELKRITADRDAKTARMWQLGKDLDEQISENVRMQRRLSKPKKRKTKLPKFSGHHDELRLHHDAHDNQRMHNQW